MDLGLGDRVVAVAGAGAGIGRASALEIAGAGASIVVGARDRDAIADTAAAARALDVPAVEVVADLATESGVADLIEAAVGRLGRLDGLVCCVGSTPLGDFSALTDDQWWQAFEMKVLATIRAIRAAHSHLAVVGGGRVVVVTGNASRTRFPYLLTSTVMNAGLESLVSSLAVQFATDGIAINAVSPGPVNTRRYEGTPGGGCDSRGPGLARGGGPAHRGVNTGRTRQRTRRGSPG